MSDSNSRTVGWETWSCINDQLQRYADAIDRADLAGLLALFTPDAIWDYAPGLAVRGQAGIADFFRERFSVFARTSHHVGPPTLERDTTDGAIRSTAYFAAVHLLRSGTRYSGYGRYIDRFVAIDDTWRIARRQVVAHDAIGTHRTMKFLDRMTSAL